MSGSSVPRVLVMMATYNGEKYLEEQIDSILKQQNVSISLVIRDDCSSDGTTAICEKYNQKYDCIDYKQNQCNKGYVHNFIDMLYSAESDRYDYFAFSDQDDVWLPNKLAEAINRINELENKEPILYYSDVTNVDSALNHSRSGYSEFSQCVNPLKTALFYNWACGCTMVWNRSFCKLVQEHPQNNFPRIHDVWLHLIGLTCGSVISDFENSYILRRISGTNQIGELSYGKFDLQRIIQHVRKIFTKPARPCYECSHILLEAYRENMKPAELKVVEDFVRGRTSLLHRFRLVLDSEFMMPSFKETIFFHIKLLFNRY